METNSDGNQNPYITIILLPTGSLYRIFDIIEFKFKFIRICNTIHYCMTSDAAQKMMSIINTNLNLGPSEDIPFVNNEQ